MDGDNTRTLPSTYSALKGILEGRRREILGAVQARLRNARDERAWGQTDDVLDVGERIEVDIQQDLEFALIQLKLETLGKINEALARLDDGTYGRCLECGKEIGEQRLRAMPFAVRCRECQGAHEVTVRRERLRSLRGAPHAALTDVPGW